MLPGGEACPAAMAAPSTTRARRAHARPLHYVLDAPPQFGARRRMRLSPASLGGSLRTGAGGVRSDYLLVGVDMTGRVAGAWMHETMG
jgi:hypothetical protein